MNKEQKKIKKVVKNRKRHKAFMKRMKDNNGTKLHPAFIKDRKSRKYKTKKLKKNVSKSEKGS
jgi:hypothetical protein